MDGELILGVGNNAGDDVRVVVNLEIKTPSLGDTTLPEVFGFIEFLGVKGRVEQVLSQKPDLFVKSFLDLLLAGYRSLSWSGRSVATSSAMGFLLPRFALGARFQRSQHLIDSIEFGGNAAFADVLQAFGQLGIDDCPLLWGVFVVSGGQFGHDSNHAPGHLEFQHVADLDTGLLPHRGGQ
ncbi:MAG TPA: hypothetical protein VMQ56_03880, partial [Terracidiphilus sp.]|nr:hypothetical protein [Terracidiphilus sp.]